MNGYAIMAPAALGGPPGWVAWAVGGTVITVGTVLLGKEVYDRTVAAPNTTTRDRAVPQTTTRTCETCPRPYSITVHAQGVDCGGTSASTIGASALVNPSTPFPAASGVALSNVTWAMLSRRQQSVRAGVKVKLESWILARPPSGFLGQKSFPVLGMAGGVRYDTDSYGPSPNYIT
jgi:hypothetical protein